MPVLEAYYMAVFGIELFEPEFDLLGYYSRGVVALKPEPGYVRLGIVVALDSHAFKAIAVAQFLCLRERMAAPFD